VVLGFNPGDLVCPAGVKRGGRVMPMMISPRRPQAVPRHAMNTDF
jgi:hypothetical protein